MSRLMDIYEQLRKAGNDGATAAEIGEQLQIDRSTASRYLNDLVKANRIEKYRANRSDMRCMLWYKRKPPTQM